LFGFFCLSTLCLNIIPKFFTKPLETSTFYNGKLIIKFDPNKNITLIDNGFFNSKSSPEKVINYELKQYLIKNTGKAEIQNIFLLKPGLRTFKAAQALCCALEVKSITLPFFEKKLSKAASCEFFKLKELLQEKRIGFIRCREESMLTSHNQLAAQQLY
jgi:hypothetical protein